MSRSFIAEVKVEHSPFKCPNCDDSCEYNISEVFGNSYYYSRPSCKCEEKADEERIAAEEQKGKEEEIERLKKRAGINIGKLANMTFSKFKATEEQHKLAIEAIKQFLECPDRGIFFVGQAGCGKTHLAVSTLHKAIEEGISKKPMFMPSYKLMDEIRKCYSSDEEVSILEYAKHADLLVFDDLGNQRIATDERGDWVREQLFSLFYERDIYGLPTIITSNYDLKNLYTRLGEPTLSRILGLCGQPVNIKAPDYRLRQRSASN